MQDYYEILGVNTQASQEEIRAAYKRMALRYHPDRNPGDKEAEETFKRINEAYQTLSNPLKKSRYDARFLWITEELNNAYWEEIRQRRYYQWRQRQERSRYRFDRHYFKIQGLAFLVFLIMAGFCFAIIRTAHYFVRRQQEERWRNNTLSLKQVNHLFGSGRYDDAFNMIHYLQEKDPLEFRFGFARDSLVDALRKQADSEFRHKEFAAAASHYKVLKTYEHPVRFETLENMSMCQYYLGNFREALQALKHLHNQQPYNLSLVYQIGLIHLEKLDDPQEALRYFSLGKKLFKDNLSHIYGNAFQIVMDPADAPDIYYHIFIGRANANLKLGNYKEAVTDCNWAVFLRPHEGEPYYLRVLAKLYLKDRSTICDDVAKARQLGISKVERLSIKSCR